MPILKLSSHEKIVDVETLLFICKSVKSEDLKKYNYKNLLNNYEFNLSQLI